MNTDNNDKAPCSIGIAPIGYQSLMIASTIELVINVRWRGSEQQVTSSALPQYTLCPTQRRK